MELFAVLNIKYIHCVILGVALEYWTCLKYACRAEEQGLQGLRQSNGHTHLKQRRGQQRKGKKRDDK